MPTVDPKPADEYEPIGRDAPELANLDAAWRDRIFDGDPNIDGEHLAFEVACLLVRAEIGKDILTRVLMTTKCGAYVQDYPAYRLQRTIRRAYEFKLDPDLERMNRDHAVLQISGKTRVVAWGEDPDPDFKGRRAIVYSQTFEDFRNLHSNKIKSIKTAKIVRGKIQQITKAVPMGHWWLDQTRRRQYDGGYRFMPKYEAEVVGDTLNLFEGFPVRPRKPEGRSGASGCKLFLDHARKIICSGNEEHYDYLIKYEAWGVRYRQRSEIAVGLHTEEEGTGKGIYCNTVGYLYGNHYMQINKPTHIVGKHNAHMEYLLKLCADEALFVGNHEHRNTLYNQITEPTLTIEPKFIGVYQVPNYLNIYIISNAKHFVPVSNTARRLFIPTVSLDRLQDFDYFSAIKKQLIDEYGYEALMYHFLYEVDLRDFNIRKAPKTAGLAKQAAYSRKGVDGLVEKACSEAVVPCAHGKWPGFSMTGGDTPWNNFDRFIDQHPDMELRRQGALRVKKELREDWGCITGKHARKYDQYDEINGIRWPDLQELREKFVEKHGPQDWLVPDATEWSVLWPGIWGEPQKL